MKSLAAAVEDFGKDPDSVTAKDFLLLIMGYYIMKVKKAGFLTRKRGG